MNKNTLKDSIATNEDSLLSQNSLFAYLNDISQYKVLSVDEELDLFQKIQNGDDVARELFIKSNLRLVVSVAKKYHFPGQNQLLDLIQDGNIGLLKAVELFDPQKECKFSTYAVYQINKAIQGSSCRTNLPVEVPVWNLSLINKIRFTKERMEIENGNEPSVSELAEQLGVPTQKIVALMPFVVSPISFQSKLREDEDEREFGEVFARYYDDAGEPERTYIIKEMRHELHNVLDAVLNDKERYIIYSRWGLSDMPIKSVAALAKELDMSIQGVRQSEGRSLMKLHKHFLSLHKSFTDIL